MADLRKTDDPHLLELLVFNTEHIELIVEKIDETGFSNEVDGQFIYIGHNSSVGTSGDNGGYNLDGEVFIDVDNLEKVFVVASAAGATVSYVAS